MSSDYEAVYNAVKTRLNQVDFEGIVSRAFDISYARATVEQELLITVSQWARPSAIYRPRLTKINGGWVAVYYGVLGNGRTPDEAMQSFDTNWRKA